MKMLVTIMVNVNRQGTISEPDYLEDDKPERVYLGNKEVLKYVRESVESWCGQLPAGHPLRSIKVEGVVGGTVG